MRLLLDACLSPRLVPRIADLFDDVVHVFDCGGIASDDTCIWDFAKDGRYTIVTKDSDFFYRSELAGFPPKVVWLRVGNAGTSTVAQLVRARAPALKSFDRDPNAAILVVDL